MANQQTSIKSENLEEIRENVMEVRLALQKGDLIEALQYLNNVDEDLLLLESGLQPSNSASVYGNSSNSDSASNPQTPEASKEDGSMGTKHDRPMTLFVN